MWVCLREATTARGRPGMRVAVLGTGTMGAGMARSLRRAGMDVAIWNRTRSRAEALRAEGITVAASVGDAVTSADVVITMVFDVDAVLEVAAELVGALGAEATWLQCSTVGPAGMARIVAAAGSAAIVDAPVLGTKEPAERGTLTVLVSGDSGRIDRVGAVLDAIGAKTVRAGERIGEASALKLAGNAWIATLTAATAQSLALAAALGVEGSLFLDAIRDTPTDSPYAQLKGPAMGAGDYSPSFAVDGLVKDLGLMLDAAESTGFTDVLLGDVRALYQRASAQGHGRDDIASIRTVFGP